jgi:hypothetical protein
LSRDSLGFRLLFCFNLVIIVAVAAACQAQAQPSDANSASKNTSSSTDKDKVVLKVGDLQITKGAFEQYVADLEATQGPADASRKKLGTNYSDMLILEKLATADRLQDSPEVVRQLAIDRMQILSNAEWAKLKKQSAATPAEVKAYYDAHLDDFDTIEMRRLFIWASAKEPNAKGGKDGMTVQQADALAAAVRQAHKSGADLSRIQKLINDTPHGSDDVTIDTEPLTFSRKELPKELNDTAFRLKEGEWTELHNGPGSYIFLQAVKRSRKDLPAVTAQIEQYLQGQKLRAALQSLKQKTGIWMDETYFVSKPEVPDKGETD